MNEVECPRCRGVGGAAGIACGSFGCRRMSFKCDLCAGTGRVDPIKLEWVERGVAMKAARLAANRTQRMEATRRGIDIVELSRMERGSIEPVEAIE